MPSTFAVLTLTVASNLVEVGRFVAALRKNQEFLQDCQQPGGYDKRSLTETLIQKEEDLMVIRILRWASMFV